MTQIYEQHDAAFSHVAAYVILRGSNHVAKVAIKRGASGLRTTAFVHWLGTPMVKGVANGGGYDKDSASVASAARKIQKIDRSREAQERRDLGKMAAAMQSELSAIADNEIQALFVKAASLDGGKHWDNALRDAGFTVIQAV